MLAGTKIEYRCEDRKMLATLETLLIESLDSLFQKTPIIAKKKRTVLSKNSYMDTVLSQSLDLSNSKPGCRVSNLHFFVK
jgi:hypothetical protein